MAQLGQVTPVWSLLQCFPQRSSILLRTPAAEDLWRKALARLMWEQGDEGSLGFQEAGTLVVHDARFVRLAACQQGAAAGRFGLKAVF